NDQVFGNAGPALGINGLENFLLETIWPKLEELPGCRFARRRRLALCPQGLIKPLKDVALDRLEFSRIRPVRIEPRHDLSPPMGQLMLADACRPFQALVQ